MHSRTFLYSRAIFLAVFGLASSALAQGGGQEVVVVYNKKMPESKAVAEHYADLRRVPANQVVGFETTTNAEMSRAEFRSTLERPLADFLSEKRLWEMRKHKVSGASGAEGPEELRVVSSKIRYAVMCYGIPYRIVRDPNLKEEGTETWKPEFQRNEAAVDSELALLPRMGQHLVLAGPLRSLHYGTTNATSLHPTNGILLVARLDGPCVAVARGLVDKAIEAEQEGLWGRAYFDLRNLEEPAYKPGDDSIRNAAEMCRRLGFETIVDTNGGTFPTWFPMSQIAYYAGWYDETVSGPFTLPIVEFMPGAFAYHLHSFSAASLRSTNHNWVGPLLAKGVTATMGTVDEPYLGGTPDMAIFTARLLYEGFTFGEAAYAAQSVLSWQTTVVGDPLYRPAGRNPDSLHQELVRKGSKLAEWSLLRLVDLNQANGRPLEQLATFLEEQPLTKKSAVLSEKLAEMYLALGKPSSAVFMYSQALKLDPSPQQRVRLRLALGEKLEAANQASEALENYKKLLEERPDYADKTSLERRMTELLSRVPTNSTNLHESKP